MSTTPQQRIEEITRELRMRQRVYPGWIISKKITETDAAHRIAVLQDVLADLKRLYPQPEQTSLAL